MSGYPIDRRIKHATLNAFKADKIPVDSTYFDNTGSLITPKTTITQQGNSFNGANQLVRLDSNLKLPVVDGSNLTNVVASGLAPSVPYSVISALTSSGVALFIIKTSNTQIDFDTNSGSNPVTICYPDGSIETNNTLTGISAISTDNTYYVIKEKGSNPYNTTLLPVEQYTAPSSPSTNQLWLDISVMPYIPKKWNGSSWVITQFVKLGEFTRTSGVIGTPISYALKGVYRDSISTLAASSSYTISHNIGVDPRYLKVNTLVQIKNVDGGFSVGEIIDPSNDNYIGSSGATGGGYIVTQARNSVRISIGNDASIMYIAKTGGISPVAVSNAILLLVVTRNF